MDMPGFLSIPYEMFPEFVVQETIEQMVVGQISEALVNKRLKKNHIGHVQSLAKWHCHLMAQSGKQLTNDEWHNLDRDSFNDIKILIPSLEATTSSSLAIHAALISILLHWGRAPDLSKKLS